MKAIAFALFGAALSATPLVILTTSTTCTSGATTITDPTHCAVGTALGNADWFEETGGNELAVDLFLEASALGSDTAAAHGEADVFATTRGNQTQAGFVLFQLDPANSGGAPCTASLAVNTTSVTRACAPAPNPFHETVPILLGQTIHIHLDGDFMSVGAGDRMVAMESALEIFRSDGVTPAEFAPEPGTWLLFAGGFGFGWLLTELRRRFFL